MTTALYLVSGSRKYRGHEPGSTFQARLDEHAEYRAVVRGDIQVLERFVPALPPVYRLPLAWADSEQATEGSG